MNGAGTVMIMAKTPQLARTKTRLAPRLAHAGACEVAWACLLDTLDVVAATTVARRVLVIDGDTGPWVPAGFEVVHQRGAGLDERLAWAFAEVGGPTVAIAMDTPQVTPELLLDALARLDDSADAVFGPATDGGYWLIGLRAGIDAHGVFDGIPMSHPQTGAAQLDRLRRLGLVTVVVDTLRDVDEPDDVIAVANLVPGSRLAEVAERHRELLIA